MRASGQSPAARRADISASKPSSTSKTRPRRALNLAPASPSVAGRIGRASVGVAASAALVTGVAYATAEPAAAASASHAPSLHKGDTGKAVVRLQRELSARKGKNVPDTGYFGPQTKKRVNKLKHKHHWRADGIAGHRVWKLLLNDKNHVSGPALNHKASKKKKAVKSAHASSKGGKALSYAKKQLGDPYVYGANGPGSFDCSGLTQAAWKSAGVKLAHNTNAQYRSERKVAKSSLKKGDLVFFYSGRSHVGIYAGHGKVIHSPRPGQGVQYIKMKYMPYNGAVRPA